jgi:hypothetical protein
MIVSKIQNQPFKLTREHLYNPGHLNGSDKMYITSNIIYNRDFLLKLDYTDRIQFLFDKNVFSKQIQKMVEKNKLDISTIKNTDYFHKNVLITLELLFPTYFPIRYNNANSYDQYINNKPVPISSITTPVKYSYIKIGKKPNTIIKSVWLNDYINHPLYKTLYNEYGKFITWKTDETLKINEETNNAEINVKESYKTYFITNIDKEIESITKNINIIQSKYTDPKYINLIDKSTKLKNDVSEIMRLGNSTDNSESYITNMYDKFNDINYFIHKFEGNTFSPILSDNFKQNVKLFYKIIKHAYKINKINTLYFKNNTINMNIDNTEQSMNDLFKSKYSRYVNFITLFTNYLKRESTNPEFQKMMVDFSTNTNNTFHIFNQQIDNALNDKSKIEEQSKQLSYIGANIISDVESKRKLSNNYSHYEIYVGLDIIDGKIDDSNKNNIDCNFKSLHLGNKLENILSKQNNIIYQPEHYAFNDDVINPKKPKQELNKKQKGGKTRNLRLRKRKTTRKINRNIKY